MGFNVSVLLIMDPIKYNGNVVPCPKKISPYDLQLKILIIFI